MPIKKILGPKSGNVKVEAEAKYDAAILAATKVYIGRGWRVLPFYRGDGICHLTSEDAEAFTCTANEVSEKFTGFDVGIDMAESGLVDLDVDCPEAVPFIQWLLPKTTTMGRTGKQMSHLLFKRIGATKSESFKDPTKDPTKAHAEMLAVKPKVRLALPPSRYRNSGEPLTWTHDCDPTEIVAAELNKIAGEIAALAFITRLWPGKGNHHNATLALAGAFARAKWPLDKTLHAVTLICAYTHDSKVEERHEEVKSTYERYEKGETNITGLPILAEELASTKAPGSAKAIKDKLHSWLWLDPDATLDLAPDSTTLYPHIYWGEAIKTIPATPVEHAVTPVFQMAAIHGLYADKGAGKTFFMLEGAVSMALGKKFLKWSVPKPRRVLYVDGEMGAAEMIDRLRLMTPHIPANLGLLSVDYLRSLDINVNIAQEKVRAAISAALKSYEDAGTTVEVLILDNLFSLAFGIDLKDAVAFDPIREWFLQLKAKGLCIILLDHENRAGGFFGTVSKIVNAAVILHLKKEGEGLMPGWTRLSVEVEYARSFSGDQQWLACEFGNGKTLHGTAIVWDWDSKSNGGPPVPPHITTLYHINAASAKKVEQIEQATGKARSTVQDHLSKLRSSGWLSKKGYAITTAGMATIKQHYPGFDLGVKM